MAIALADLVAHLQEDVPARDSTPSADQYERCIKDAVADFSRKTGRIKIATINVVSGTATYTLPSDFVKLIRMESLTTPDGVIISGAGLIPVSATYKERWTVADDQITFYPTPTYSLARDFEYQAGWVLDANDQYQEIGEGEVEILIRMAASKALTFQANKAAQQAWQYAIGDERVSKERLAGELREQARQAMTDYLEAVKTYNGAIGRRSSYSKDAYS